MADASSNLHEIARQLDAVLDGLDFTASGSDGRGLAAELLDVIAEGIADRSLADQKAPSGAPWEPNEAEYKARKGGKPIGVLTGEMLSLEQLKGERQIDAESARMVYGRNGHAKDKAEWFTTGSGGKRAARPFYDLDADIERKLDERVAKAIDEYFDRLGLLG